MACSLCLVTLAYRDVGELLGVDEGIVFVTVSIEDIVCREMDVLVVHDDDAAQHANSSKSEKSPPTLTSGGEQ